MKQTLGAYPVGRNEGRGSVVKPIRTYLLIPVVCCLMPAVIAQTKEGDQTQSGVEHGI